MLQTKNNIEELKKEINAREADYEAMDSEQARKEDERAAYGRYMRYADGMGAFGIVIALLALLVFAVVLAYAVLEAINGNTEPAVWAATGIACAACLLLAIVIFILDIIKRNAEAKMRLSSHIYRYNMQVKIRKAELDELKAKLKEAEKAEK